MTPRRWIDSLATTTARASPCHTTWHIRCGNQSSFRAPRRRQILCATCISCAVQIKRPHNITRDVINNYISSQRRRFLSIFFHYYCTCAGVYFALPLDGGVLFPCHLFFRYTLAYSLRITCDQVKCLLCLGSSHIILCIENGIQCIHLLFCRANFTLMHLRIVKPSSIEEEFETNNYKYLVVYYFKE